MAKVMSPNAPANESRGMRAADRYYGIMYLKDTPQAVIESAEHVCSAYARMGDEWCAGFMRMAVICASSRKA